MSLPLLFPHPRVVAAGSGPAVSADSPVTFECDAGLPSQGYEIQAGEQRIRVRYADAAGRRYAEQTLAQLRRGGDTIPAIDIRDWPDFAARGFLLDVSRDRVPTLQTLERLVAILELCRINHLQLYIEHTFAYREHAVVWRDAAPLTDDDLRRLDRYCAERGIELSINQNCFGHMERWLKHDNYRDRAEAPDGWRSTLGGLIPPAVLAPNQDNARFALALIAEIMDCIGSKRINIGCDETFELGRGKSAAAVAARGRGRVYFEHLQRLIEPLRARRYEVQFWGDILRHHPELVAELPPDHLTALVWHYEAPLDPTTVPEFLIAALAEFGVDADVLRGFAGQTRAFQDSGFPHWVCPGTSSWNSLVGRVDNAKTNLREAAAVGIASGASGYLITDWGDNGHLQPPSVSWPPLLYGAGLAWCADAHRVLDIAAVLDQLVFDDASRRLGSALLTLGDLYRQTGKLGFNASPLFTALLQRALLGSIGSADAAGLGGVLATLTDCGDEIAAAQPRCADAAIVRRELSQAARLARHGAWRLCAEIDAPRPSDAALRRDLDEAIDEQRACWLLRSRAGGLDDSLARLERTRDRY